MTDWRDLTPDQLTGAQFLASRRIAMLADKPGLGKTAQLVHACDRLGAERVLVVCPPILRDNVAREFDKWSYLGYDATAIRTGRDALPKRGVVAVSYQLAVTLRDALRDWRPDVLACDEAHALKSPSAERTKAVLSAKGLARGAGAMWWLTGTPMPNHAGELYTFARACGAWTANITAFEDAFCVVVETEHGSKPVANKNAAGLRALLAPYYLRRDKIEGLPPLRLNTVSVRGDVRAVTRAQSEDLRAALEAAERLNEWQFFETPFVSTIRHHVGFAKADAAADLILEELHGGEPNCVVFAHHKDTIAALRSRLEPELGGTCATIDGTTPVAHRQKHIDAFQSGALRVLILQAQAASEGITLTAASRVFLVEPDWTPSRNEQMIARCWRRGQINPVRATFVSLHNSIDDTILRTLERKMRMISEII